MKHYNAGTTRERLMNYSAWVSELRTPLEGRRAEIVSEALKVAGNTVGQAKAAFKFDVFD